jgi:hypothetical protein
MITPQQFKEMEMRLHGKVFITHPINCGKTILAKELESESDLHNQIIDYCDSKGWQYLHGSMARRTHRTEGEPDFTILAHGSQIRLVECKSKTGKLSKEQQAFIAHAAKNGHVVHVVRSLEEFAQLFA